MDELDLKIAELLSALAKIVNRASRSFQDSTEHRYCKVPVALLAEARAALEGWRDTEYTTTDIRQATNRLLD